MLLLFKAKVALEVTALPTHLYNDNNFVYTSPDIKTGRFMDDYRRTLCALEQHY
jgi:hypothetical protein